MILTAHQPSYLPWLGLFAKMVKSDVFVFADTVNYSSRSWSNRNKIRTVDGWMWLTVPVHGQGNGCQPFTEIKIDNTQEWRRKHWKSIEMNYSRAPYFHLYRDFFKETYSREWTYLTDLNEHITRFLIEVLGIRVKFVKASSSLKLEGSKSSLVIDMCLKLKADVFIFGSSGKNYVNIEDFKSAGVKAVFQDYNHPTYPQFHGKFISHLSVIDLLFNCGPKSSDILISNQKAIEH